MRFGRPARQGNRLPRPGSPVTRSRVLSRLATRARFLSWPGAPATRSRASTGEGRSIRLEGGAATAELAVAIPSLVLVLAVALGAVELGLAQVRCVDAARLGARALARGDDRPAALAAVRAAAPPGATVSVSTYSGRVSVAVTADVPRVLGPLGGVARPTATAEAVLEGTP